MFRKADQSFVLYQSVAVLTSKMPRDSWLLFFSGEEKYKNGARPRRAEPLGEYLYLLVLCRRENKP